MKNKITIRLIHDYNFDDNFIMPELNEDDKNRLELASQYTNDNFWPKNGKSRSYWSKKDKLDFCKFAKENL